VKQAKRLSEEIEKNIKASEFGGFLSCVKLMEVVNKYLQYYVA
jgi:hypothetical protein